MPNLKHSPKPEQQELLTVTGQSAVDDYRSQRANLAALLEAYQATGIADQQLISLGLVHDAG